MEADILVSADFLLRGAFYAAEQGGILLHDAVHLYKLARFGSAAVLGVYSREEIGRAGILLDYRERVLLGEVIKNDDEFRTLIHNHIKKLEAGQLFVNIEFPERKLREIPAEEIGRPRYYAEDAPFYEECARRVEKARKERAHMFHEQTRFARAKHSRHYLVCWRRRVGSSGRTAN
jgi:AbiV family abortive infection protein